jgi:hypothetical protein
MGNVIQYFGSGLTASHRRRRGVVLRRALPTCSAIALARKAKTRLTWWRVPPSDDERQPRPGVLPFDECGSGTGADRVLAGASVSSL